jgi:hypothetical protein
MIRVFAGKVRKTGFFQKPGFPGNSEGIFGIYYDQSLVLLAVRYGMEPVLNRLPLRSIDTSYGAVQKHRK